MKSLILFSLWLVISLPRHLAAQEQAQSPASSLAVRFALNQLFGTNACTAEAFTKVTSDYERMAIAENFTLQDGTFGSSWGVRSSGKPICQRSMRITMAWIRSRSFARTCTFVIPFSRNSKLTLSCIQGLPPAPAATLQAFALRNEERSRWKGTPVSNAWQLSPARLG